MCVLEYFEWWWEVTKKLALKVGRGLCEERPLPGLGDSRTVGWNSHRGGHGHSGWHSAMSYCIPCLSSGCIWVWLSLRNSVCWKRKALTSYPSVGLSDAPAEDWHLKKSPIDFTASPTQHVLKHVHSDTMGSPLSTLSTSCSFLCSQNQPKRQCKDIRDGYWSLCASSVFPSCCCTLFSTSHWRALKLNIVLHLATTAQHGKRHSGRSALKA